MTDATKGQPRKKSRLGKGLSSLMGQPVTISPPVHEIDERQAGSSRSDDKTNRSGSIPAILEQNSVSHPTKQDQNPDADPSTFTDMHIYQVPVASLRPSRHQPRQDFDQAALESLADSIRADGLIQPLIVRPTRHPQDHSSGDSSADPQYELIAGERRWRAAQRAGMTHVPVVVKDLDDRQTAEWSLIENLQREDLNPIERAEAFEHLIHQFGLSHDQIAQRIGIDRSSVSNLLRLLSLSDKARAWVRDDKLSLGHAKVLAGLEDDQQIALGSKVISNDLSVREAEKIASQIKQQGRLPAVATDFTSKKNKPAFLSDLEEAIGQQLGTKVKVRKGRKKGSGTLLIDFYSLDEFDALLARLGVAAELG